MIAVVTSYDIPPLRCQECSGTGRVDGTREYLDQLFRGGEDDVVYMGGEPHLKACYVCSGTGRHVSRARAGLAAAPITYVDIETGGLNHSFAEAEQSHQDGVDAIAMALGLMRIIDDPVRPLEDEAAERERMKSWFDTPFPHAYDGKISLWQTSFRPRLDWWSKSIVVADEVQNLTREALETLEQEHPPLWPDGIPEKITMEMVADLHRIGDAANVFILGDPEDEEQK